jgi:hypothetical protein
MDQTKIKCEEETGQVAGPAWLQKRMRRNLVRASLDRTNQIRAEKALRILETPKIVAIRVSLLPDTALAEERTGSQLRPTGQRCPAPWSRVVSALKSFVARFLRVMNTRKRRQPG